MAADRRTSSGKVIEGWNDMIGWFEKYHVLVVDLAKVATFSGPKGLKV